MASFYEVPVFWHDGRKTIGRAIGNNAAWLCQCKEILIGPHEKMFPIDPCPKCDKRFRIVRGVKPQYVAHVEEIVD